MVTLDRSFKLTTSTIANLEGYETCSRLSLALTCASFIIYASYNGMQYYGMEVTKTT